MPLYLVRWPNLSFCFVNARNEEQLIDILDEVADPGVCRWTVYKGPLFLDFELDANDMYSIVRDGERGPIKDITLKTVPQWDGVPRIRLSEEGGDTYYEMMTRILEFAFPHLVDQVGIEEDAPDEEELRAALLKELDALRDAERKRDEVRGRTDPEGLLMQHLGVTRNPFDKQKTQVLYYQRLGPGRFELIEVPRFSAFMLGKERLPADADGAVRYVEVNIRHQGKKTQAALRFTRIATVEGVADQKERKRLVDARQRMRSDHLFRVLLDKKDPPGVIPASRLERLRHDREWGWQPTEAELAALDEALERDTGLAFGPPAQS